MTYIKTLSGLIDTFDVEITTYRGKIVSFHDKKFK